MKNKDGELVETEKEVKEVYTEFYKDLFSTSLASTQKEQLAEDNVNKLFRLIEIIAENQEPNEYIKKGSKLLIDNKSGIFLTNILSKLYEEVLDLLTTGNVKINEHQYGGQKGVER